MIHYLWKISGAKAQKSDAVLREDFCRGNLVSDRAMTGGNRMKIRTRLAIAFVTITVVPIVLIFVAAFGLVNYQEHLFQKTYGLSEQIDLLSGNQTQVFNRLTQGIQEEIREAVGKNTDLFESIFKEILARATKCGFVDSSNIYIDSTHIKASANKKKYTKVEVDIQAKHYQEKLEKEINEDRLKHGKSPLCEVKNEEVKKKEKIESNTDKDSGMFFKNEKEKCFAYLAHTACDNNNFILDFHITSGNIHDSVAFSDLYQKIKNNSKQHTTAIAIDAGYITPYICKTILDDGIIPAIPYKRPMTKKGFFKKYEYVYDEYYDCYICPNNKILKYSTTNRDGYREYKSNPSDCKSCEHLNICTNSKNKQKLVTRHIWQNYLEEADHLRHKPYVKKVYSKRKETIERVFADAKEKHGMRYTKLRGLSKIEMEVSLIFSCMNLKKLANWMWKDTSSNLRLTPIFSILSLKIFIKKKIAI